MKKLLIAMALAIPLLAPSVQAGDVGFHLSLAEPPVFLAPPPLGFYVAVGIPYDIFYVTNHYYLYRDHVWYRAPHYHGPWVVVHHKNLPRALREHEHHAIRHYRDEEYKVYVGDKDHYHGKHFRPDKEWKRYHDERVKKWKKHHKDDHKRGDQHGHKHGYN